MVRVKKTKLGVGGGVLGIAEPSPPDLLVLATKPWRGHCWCHGSSCLVRLPARLVSVSTGEFNEVYFLFKAP